MKFKKLATSLLLSGSILLVACGNGEASDNGSESGDEALTLTFFSSDLQTDDPFTNPVAKKITEETGVNLKISHPVRSEERRVGKECPV